MERHQGQLEFHYKIKKAVMMKKKWKCTRFSWSSTGKVASWQSVNILHSMLVKIEEEEEIAEESKEGF